MFMRYMQLSQLQIFFVRKDNNRQNVNIRIRNWDTNKDRQKATEHF